MRDRQPKTIPILAISGLVLATLVYGVLTLLLETYRIPSAAMMPTLVPGDVILVKNYAYGYKLPYTDAEIIPGNSPRRGDVVVFRYPKDESQMYIKRIVGLPGDRVSYFDRRVGINNSQLKTEHGYDYVPPADTENAYACNKQRANCQVYFEYIDQRRYTIMLNPDSNYGINGETVVPQGQFFVLGDNRDHSNDSRVWGFVPAENISGKATRVLYNFLALERSGRMIE